MTVLLLKATKLRSQLHHLVGSVLAVIVLAPIVTGKSTQSEEVKGKHDFTIWWLNVYSPSVISKAGDNIGLGWMA